MKKRRKHSTNSIKLESCGRRDKREEDARQKSESYSQGLERRKNPHMSRSPFFFPLSFIAVVSCELLPTETGCDGDALEIAYCHHYKRPPCTAAAHTACKCVCGCARRFAPEHTHKTWTHTCTYMQNSSGVHSPALAPVRSLFSPRPAGKPR